MPTSPVSMCRDCTSRVLPGTSYCAEHQQNNNAVAYKQTSRIINDTTYHLYRCTRWTGPYGSRLQVLRRDPLCCLCGHRASKIADHHPMTAREVVAQFGISAFYDLTRLRGLCASCHSSKEAKQTGFASPSHTRAPSS